MSLEKRIVELFKGLLYQSMIESRYTYRLSEKAFEFALAGTGALEFISVKKALVNTVDADMHFWNIGGLSYTRALARSAQEIFEDIFFRFNHAVQEYYQSQLRYFQELIRVQDPDHYEKSIGRFGAGFQPVWGRGGRIPHSFIGRIRILGYDMADLVMEATHPPNEYFSIPAGFKADVPRNQMHLNVLTPTWFLLNHLEMLSFQYYEPIDRFINLKNVHAFYAVYDALPEDDPLKVGAPEIGRIVEDGKLLYVQKHNDPRNREILTRWGFFVLLNILLFNRQVVGLEDVWLGETVYSTDQIDAYSEAFKDFIERDYYLYPRKGDAAGVVSVPPKSPARKFFERTRKSAKRLYILFYTMWWSYESRFGGWKPVLHFREGRTSCITLVNAEDVQITKTQQDRCETKIVMGFGVDREIPEAVLDENVRVLDQELTFLSSSAYRGAKNIRIFQDGRCRPSQNNYLKVPLETLKNMSPADAVCLWSVNSRSLTNIMTQYQLLSEFGLLSESWFTKRQSSIAMMDKLEQAAQTVLDTPLEAYKTSRHVIYRNGDTSYDLQKGKKYPLMIFNSATLKKNLNGLIAYASFETGTSCYTIVIPAGVPFIYIGRNPDRTAYPLEYEVLLPPGGTFDILDIDEESYVGYCDRLIGGKLACSKSEGDFFSFGMKHYLVRYLPPSRSFAHALKTQLPAPPLPSPGFLYTVTAPSSGFIPSFPMVPSLPTPPKKKKKVITAPPAPFTLPPSIGTQPQELLLDGNLGYWLPDAIKKYFPDVLQQWKRLSFSELYQAVVRFTQEFAASIINYIPWSPSVWFDSLQPAFDYVFDQVGIVVRAVKKIFLTMVSSILTAMVQVSNPIRQRVTRLIRSITPTEETLHLVVNDLDQAIPYKVKIGSLATVDDLKRQLYVLSGIRPKFQVLSYKGKELESGSKLSRYTLEDKSLLEVYDTTL